MKNLQEYTRLPIKAVQSEGVIFPDIIITTPHKGDVVIKLKERHIPFMFGSATQTDRNIDEVIRDIQNIEKESMEYLFTQWLQNK